MGNSLKQIRRAAVMAGAVVALAPQGASAADLGPVPYAAAASTAVYSGINAKEDAWYAYLGASHALNGDIGVDGWLVRALIGGGEVDYDAGGALGNVDSDIFDADLMIGYQIFEGRNRYTAYIGGHYRDNDLSPNDPGNSTRGDELGVKFQLEANSWMGDLWNLNAMGSYSTVNDAYWARLRVGYDFGGGLLIGPEGIVNGDDEYDEQRIGAFVGGIPLGPFDASVAVGYANVDGRGTDDSIYGSLDLSILF